MLQVSFQEQRWIPPSKKGGSFNIPQREQGLAGKETWKFSIYIEKRK